MPPKSAPAPKVAKELCEKEFERLCEVRRIETDPENMSKLELVLFESRKTAILRVMGRGDLVISKDGDPVYTPPGGEALTFHKPTGATLMAQDGFPQNHDVARAAAVATEMTKVAPGALSKLSYPDFEVACELSNFLLGR